MIRHLRLPHYLNNGLCFAFLPFAFWNCNCSTWLTALWLLAVFLPIPLQFHLRLFRAVGRLFLVHSFGCSLFFFCRLRVRFLSCRFIRFANASSTFTNISVFFLRSFRSVFSPFVFSFNAFSFSLRKNYKIVSAVFSLFLLSFFLPKIFAFFFFVFFQQKK